MKSTKLEPTARIAVKKNVLKQYSVNNEDVVYLAKDAEFEIELFNPLQETVLARIFLNGNEIPGNGLILRPGERVFLERFLESDKKFKFDVYQVENSQEAKNATANNGLVTVKFYKEFQTQKLRSPWVINSGTAYINPQTVWYSAPTQYLNSVSCNVTADSGSFNTASSSSTVTLASTFDTGLVTKGSTSQQELEYVDMDFYNHPFTYVTVRILPDSRKPYTTEEIKHRKYCTECGSKIKSTDKFCAECGTKL